MVNHRDYSDLTSLLATKAIVGRSDLGAAGIERRKLDAAVEQGVIEKIRKGIYAAPSALGHGAFDLAYACHLSGGVVWGASAARLHELTDDIPYDVGILVPHDRGVLDFSPIQVTARRTRDAKSLEVGVVDLDYDGLHVRTTDQARTVVDLVRWGEVRQHVVEAVRAYLAAGLPTDDLMMMSREFGAYDEVVAISDGVLAAFERSPTPGF